MIDEPKDTAETKSDGKSDKATDSMGKSGTRKKPKLTINVQTGKNYKSQNSMGAPKTTDSNPGGIKNTTIPNVESLDRSSHGSQKSNPLPEGTDVALQPLKESIPVPMGITVTH